MLLVKFWQLQNLSKYISSVSVILFYSKLHVAVQADHLCVFSEWLTNEGSLGLNVHSAALDLDFVIYLCCFWGLVLLPWVRTSYQ